MGAQLFTFSKNETTRVSLFGEVLSLIAFSVWDEFEYYRPMSNRRIPIASSQ